MVFGTKVRLSFEDYCYINKRVSSEFFTSLMRVLQDHLPCSNNFFLKKRQFRQNKNEEGEEELVEE